jgi:hypothetical protein
MSASTSKSLTPARLAVDAGLCALFFVVLFGLLKAHVPSPDPRMVALWAGAAASCMTAVFWLAVQMFRVVLRAQREARQAK